MLPHLHPCLGQIVGLGHGANGRLGPVDILAQCGFDLTDPITLVSRSGFPGIEPLPIVICAADRHGRTLRGQGLSVPEPHEAIRRIKFDRHFG